MHYADYLTFLNLRFAANLWAYFGQYPRFPMFRLISRLIVDVLQPMLLAISLSLISIFFNTDIWYLCPWVRCVLLLVV